MDHAQDSARYRAKKMFLEKVLTVYGRKAVLEALQDPHLDCHKLHLATGNREDGIIKDIRKAARRRETPIVEHRRDVLARISKNRKQDQGVALDILCPQFLTLNAYLEQQLSSAEASSTPRILALDGINNPQNLGMIIRSATGGGMDAILLARKGKAALGPLVIKASAGTVFRAPIVVCDELIDSLMQLQHHGAKVYTLTATAGQSLFTHSCTAPTVYVLGNESCGVSAAVDDLADGELSIPMKNGVESLNVAVAAALIAYAPYRER